MAPTPRIIETSAIQAVVKLDERAIDAAESAFRKLGAGQAVTLPVQQIDCAAHHGQTCVKSGYVPGEPFFVVKVASTFHDNAAIGLPARSGLMLVFDARTGHLDTILLDDGYLTAVRTAAAGALVARILARPESSRAAVIGCGSQAELQLEALTLVRPLRSATVWGPRASSAADFARRMTARLGLPVEPAASVAAATAEADIVVTTTPARAPVLCQRDLRPGTHVTAIGADAPGKTELEPAIVALAEPYVCDLRSQCARLGELRAAIDAGVVPGDFVAVELGRLLTGATPWRRQPAAITVCDLTGVGIQDTEIALLARRLLRDG